MKRLLLSLLLALPVAGCERQDEAGGGSPSAGGRPVSVEQARQLLWKLPEVRAWARSVRSKSWGKVVPVSMVERTPSEAAGGQRPGWVFYVGESHKGHTVLWNRFRVDAASGEISVWDPFYAAFKPLAEWRKKLALEK